MTDKTVYVKPFACSIVDVFEDFLGDKEIDIPNDEKEGYEEEACIYGQDFDDLMENVTALLVEMLEPLGVKIDTESWNN